MRISTERGRFRSLGGTHGEKSERLNATQNGLTDVPRLLFASSLLSGFAQFFLYAQYDDFSIYAEEESNDPAENTLPQNISYELIIGNETYTLDNLATYNVSVELQLPDTRSLRHLFMLNTAFIDAVWQPFETIEDFLFELLTLQVDDHLDYVSNNWQKVAKFETGYLICLAFGLLFVISMPIVGLIFCSCRLCNNCGGRRYQDIKDAKSGWRIFHFLALMLTNSILIIPMVFIFLTNDWIGTVLQEAGPAVLANIDHIYGYTGSIKTQMDDIYNNYKFVENLTTLQLENIGSVLGDPIQTELRASFNPLFGELGEFQIVLDGVTSTLSSVDQNLARISNGVKTFEGTLETIKTSIEADLAFDNCDKNAACSMLKGFTAKLQLGGDFQSLDDMSLEIKELQDALARYNLTNVIILGENAINDIPNTIDRYTSSMINDIIGPGGIFESVDQDVQRVIDQVDDYLDVNNTIDLQEHRQTVQDIANEIPEAEKYRNIIGLTIGSMVALVVGANSLGIMLGFCGYKREATPTNRSSASNLGGIFLMMSVSFSFIFGWLLMMLSIIAFTVGGHGEKYFCQTMQEDSQGNFTGLEFLHDLGASMGYNYPLDLVRPVNFTFENSTENGFMSPTEYFSMCKNNTGLYKLLELDQMFDLDELFNLTKYNQLVDEQFDQIGAVLNGTLDGFLSEDDIANIEVLKNGSWRHIDYATYLKEVNKGLTSIDLESFAGMLNETSVDIENNPSPMTNIEKATTVAKLQKHSYDVLNLYQTQIEPLESALADLENDLDNLKDTAETVDSSLDALIEEARIVNETLITVTPESLNQIARRYSSDIAGRIQTFSSWLKVQVEENVGACQPIYGIYTNVMNIACSYFVDSLNAFWFSLAWATVFLIPSMIFGAKLHKWFRRMKQEEYFDEVALGMNRSGQFYNEGFDSESDYSYSD
ncbi:Oidioi.mRNA.OKI2018_I69.XSR.g13301.t2.cds [Oikopleura dioica]|uniref:Oidioi.mRNA.OKI2018_I69.XSR.g13301.t2.cds n=1 Tax=Oikopleura dioica TaxID=34765 RepID=A0ABN7SA62_OIKDI|nr:Oidioi.mRNA.OKI2018_I69.XSR.g13301.t2.cds [Oikopleura dioica]